MTEMSPATPEAGAEIGCPFCGSAETELFALFSQFLLTSQYYCRSCKTVFDVVKWQEPSQATTAQEKEMQLYGISDPTV